ncbi:MAG: enoyl-CoA hydratase/isomerase family protein [Alphaproteobacteria bacterium]|nr:enoyl-CoA hydratase/isomerase family protein [Alphaproteobacteria bacterium]
MPVLFEKKDHVAILTLSRPEARNAWGDDYNQALRAHLAEIEADSAIRCVVLTGDPAGNAFSAGANMKNPKTHTLSSVADFIETVPRRRNHIINVIADFPKPVLAAVNGYAVGIGCIVSYCCDLIIASDKAEWRLPQVGLGILPAHGGLARLAQWIGRGLAMRMAMGFPLPAAEAHRIGLAQWLVPHETLMEEAMRIAAHIAALPPLAARMAKESLVMSMDAGPAAHADVYRFMALELTEDKEEAHRAWREKRKPRFTGR